VIAYDVLREPGFAGRTVPMLVTLGSPLGGYTEIQDVITKPLRLPAPVQVRANFADPLDVIALDTSLADEFQGAPRIIDARVDNPSPNNHAACGYLGASRVRSTVTAALTSGNDIAQTAWSATVVRTGQRVMVQGPVDERQDAKGHIQRTDPAHTSQTPARGSTRPGSARR
jgi:hypothetical protein